MPLDGKRRVLVVSSARRARSSRDDNNFVQNRVGIMVGILLTPLFTTLRRPADPEPDGRANRDGPDGVLCTVLYVWCAVWKLEPNPAVVLVVPAAENPYFEFSAAEFRSDPAPPCAARRAPARGLGGRAGSRAAHT